MSLDKNGKIIIQEKEYELCWNGGVMVKKLGGGNTIRITTDIDVYYNNEAVILTEYAREVIGRAVSQFFRENITHFACARSRNNLEVDIRLIDRDDGTIYDPHKGLNDLKPVGSLEKTE